MSSKMQLNLPGIVPNPSATKGAQQLAFQLPTTLGVVRTRVPQSCHSMPSLWPVFASQTQYARLVHLFSVPRLDNKTFTVVICLEN